MLSFDRCSIELFHVAVRVVLIFWHNKLSSLLNPLLYHNLLADRLWYFFNSILASEVVKLLPNEFRNLAFSL